MIKALTAAAMILLLAPCAALAQNRAGDAALGAVSGAVVLGPVGAVAGAFIGYTAGPSIARSWGIERSASRSRARRPTQASLGTQEQAAAKVSSPSPVKTPETVAGRKAAPPVQ